MKPSDEFFSGNRYAIFGATARGRMQGSVLITALGKAGKKAVAIEPSGGTVKGAEVVQSLADAGAVDGAVFLPPSPWDERSTEFTTDAAQQCKAQGMTKVWIYTVQDAAPAVAIAEKEGLDPVAGKCPCLYIQGGGFPHNLHQTILKWMKKL